MYSQAGQDDWVLSLFDKDYKGFFMDIGCNDPMKINNTLLLEQHSWNGIAFDIVNFTKIWMKRKATFIQANVLNCDFSKYDIPKIVDYLSLDIDDLGTNYETLKRLISFGFIFNSITIEHNLYCGEEYNECERIPQRILLYENGYCLSKSDVENGGNKFEDWWVHSNMMKNV
jgi:hypothetical protein